MEYIPVKIEGLKYTDLLYESSGELLTLTSGIGIEHYSNKGKWAKQPHIDKKHPYFKEVQNLRAELNDICSHANTNKEELTFTGGEIARKIELIPIAYTQAGIADIERKVSLYNFYYELTNEETGKFTGEGMEGLSIVLRSTYVAFEVIETFMEQQGISKVPMKLPNIIKSNFFNFLKTELISHIKYTNSFVKATRLLTVYMNSEQWKNLTADAQESFFQSQNLHSNYDYIAKTIEDLEVPIPQDVSSFIKESDTISNTLVDSISNIKNIYEPKLQELIKAQSRQVLFLSQAIEANDKVYTDISPNQLELSFATNTLPKQDIRTTISMIFQLDENGELPKGVSVSKGNTNGQPYSEFENSVVQAITGLQLNYMITTGEMRMLSEYEITSQVFIGSNPTPDSQAKVRQAIYDMSHMDIVIDCREEMKQRNISNSLDNIDNTSAVKYFRERLESKYGNYLSGKMLLFKMTKRHARTGRDNYYEFFGLPLLAEYIIATGQFTLLKNAVFKIYKFNGNKPSKNTYNLTAERSSILRYALVWASQFRDNNPKRLINTIYQKAIGGHVDNFRMDKRQLLSYNTFLIDTLKNFCETTSEKEALIKGFSVTMKNGDKYRYPLPKGNSTHHNGAYIDNLKDILDITLMRDKSGTRSV